MTDKYKELKERAKEVKKQVPDIKVKDGNKLSKIPSKVKQDYNAVKSEEEFEVDEPVHLMVQKIHDGEIDPVDLTADEKFFVIKYMREVEKKTQDKIAEELGITRRTVVNYEKKIKQFNAKKLADNDAWTIGGDIYRISMEAIEGAMQSGKYQQVAYIISTMISTLQSMGLVFKVPQRSQVQQQIMHDLHVRGAEGFTQLKQVADENEVNIDAVFEELLGSVKEGKLEKEEE